MATEFLEHAGRVFYEFEGDLAALGEFQHLPQREFGRAERYVAQETTRLTRDLGRLTAELDEWRSKYEKQRVEARTFEKQYIDTQRALEAEKTAHEASRREIVRSHQFANAQSQQTPTALASAAQDIGKRHGIPVTVLDKAGIMKEKMGALLAVAQGSVEEPRFIVLDYQGAPGAPVVLVGKGVTFDTGGISIKPALNMEEMKYDMSGAAAVLGTFEMLGRLKPKVHVVGLVPSTENMPSGTAIKPGDVVTSHLGKTIEIINTDAEGRLILADALSYARRLKPSCVIDIATLTGAIVVALGHTASGLFGTDEPLISEVRAASERADERAWPLPLWDDYRELNKSDIADVKNSGGRPGGSISAGWFLREFVDGFPWAHLDIAGTAYTEREDPSRVKGPTGTGVRLFSEFILARQG